MGFCSKLLAFFSYPFLEVKVETFQSSFNVDVGLIKIHNFVTIQSVYVEC